MINTPDVEGSAKFYTNNVVSCPVGETVAFEYESATYRFYEAP